MDDHSDNFENQSSLRREHFNGFRWNDWRDGDFAYPGRWLLRDMFHNFAALHHESHRLQDGHIRERIAGNSN